MPKITITSYEMLKRLSCDKCKCKDDYYYKKDSKMTHCLACMCFKVVIVDESHALRCTSRKYDCPQTEAAVSAVKKSKRAILLSGTPSLTKPLDLFKQVILRKLKNLINLKKGRCIVSRIVW